MRPERKCGLLNVALVCIMTGMENAKSSWFAGFGREGSSPFSCTAVILVILYIQEWRGMEKG